MKLKCCNTKSITERKQIIEFLKIISEENRLKIICLLKESDKCVCDIWEELAIAQNLSSHHLKVLKDFGLVFSEKKGLKVIYSINKDVLREYINLLDNYLN